MVNKSKSEEDIYYAALKEPPDGRPAYIKAACGDDLELIERVESLLKIREDENNFLESPPFIDQPLLNTSLQAQPGTIIDRYKLLERIGEGGMAVVYMAEQTEPIRRKVALKIIKLGMDTKSVIARFEAERQALAMMDHPNIARVFDGGATEAGRPYFVMELVKGVSITQYCDKNKLSTPERLDLFLQVCNAVQHAHQKGIIHRDIKPSNIMVTLHDGKPVPKVIDFGIAKATNQRLTEKTLFTRYAQMIGTPAYMSPEQAEMSELDVDTRTDIYSLGVLLYELLTGTTPFSEEELRKAGYLEMQRVIREQEPTKPSTKLNTLGETLTDIAKYRGSTPDLLTKAIRGDLDWIVMKSLEKDRSRRYESVTELAADIKRNLTHEPVLASPPSALYRIRKLVQRRRALVTAMSAVVAALLIGFIVSTSLYIRVLQSRNTIAGLEAQAEADRKLSTAQKLYAEGRYLAAMHEIESNLLGEDVDAKTHLLYAQILFDLGRTTDAEAQLLPLAAAEPEIAGAAHYLLARIYLNIDEAKSKEHRQQAELLLPRTADAYAIRALTAIAPDDAIQWLSKALQLDPSHYESRKARALAYYGLREYTRMRQDVEAMVVMRPKDSLSYALRALAQRELGELEEALSNHNKAIELCDVKSELPILYNQRQETYWHLGDYQGALRDAQRCVALDPETVAYRVALGKILFKVGQYEAAQEELLRARALGGHWEGVRAMIEYTWDAASTGETLEIPDNLVRELPFRAMPHNVDLCRAVEQKASRLVRGAFDVSSWSPDGKQLAYTRAEFCGWDDNVLNMAGPAGAVGARGIEILDLESGHIRVLVTSGGVPAWSPDGRFIAFMRGAGLFLDRLEAEIWLVPAAGGEPRRLARGGCPGWTNHPTRLYFHSREEKALYCLDVNDPKPKPIRVAACPGSYPHVSPDERYLAYATAGELTVVELDSGEEVVKWIVPGCEKYCSVLWSPDGKEISLGVEGARHWASGLWLFDFERRDGWHLLDPEATCCNWSPDRSRVALDLYFPVCEIWIAEVDPNLPTWEALGPLQSRAEYLRSNLWNYVTSYARAKSEDKSHVLKNLIAVGVNQYNCGEYEDALWTLQQVAKFPETEGGLPDIEATAHIAIILERLGRHQEAKQVQEHLMKILAKVESADEIHEYEVKIKAIFESSEYIEPQQ